MERCSRNIKSELEVKAQEKVSKWDRRVSGIDGTKATQIAAHL